MKKLKMLLLIATSFFMINGCVHLTKKIEDKVVEDYYPGIEEKVVENVEKILANEVKLGNIKPEEVQRAREIIYSVLIRVRNDLRSQIFDIEAIERKAEAIDNDSK